MKHILILCIRAYQIVISPLFRGCCRFTPSCSAYSVEALEKHGCFKGLWLGLKRVGRCHPFHHGGFDPVPEREDKSNSLEN